MQFVALHIAGFKSFAEPLTIDIGAGLTGIIGPNGCGKSNLFEALRWGMGETAFRQMRADSMADVIFSGSGLRAAATQAEIRLRLLLEDTDELHELAEQFALKPGRDIEISRTLTHKTGSVWRLNGREARARDIQLLFADSASGARSIAFMRQGMITDIINARPEARRKILEEAAGVSGLYVRRHDAQLRLQASEQNIARLDDVLAEKATRKKEFAKQARQAVRYRKLNQAIRNKEAELAYSSWQSAAEMLAAATDNAKALDEQHTQAETALAQARQAHTAATNACTQASEQLEACRQTHAQSQQAQAAFMAEQQQAAQRLDDLKAQEASLRDDMAMAQKQHDDACAQLAQLAREQTDLRERAVSKTDAAQQAKRVSQFEKVLQTRTEALEKAQRAWDTHSQAQAQAEAVAHSATERLKDIGRRKAQLQTSVARQNRELAALKTELGDKRAQLKTGKHRVAQAHQDAQKAQLAYDKAHTQIEKCQHAAQTAQSTYRALEQERTALTAQLETLARLFPPSAAQGNTLLGALHIRKGYDVALAAVLGEEAQAGVSAAKKPASVWRTLPQLTPPALPAGAKPLKSFVRAPAALARLLDFVGVVTPAQGTALQARLVAGQMLVSTNGDIWRWDGYHATARAQAHKTERFAQLQNWQSLQRTHTQLERKLATQKTQLAKAEADAAKTQQALAQAQTRLQAARDGQAQAMTHMEQVQAHCAQLETDQTRLAERLADDTAAQEQLQSAEAEAAQALTQKDTARHQGADVYAQLEHARTAQLQAQTDLTRATQAQDANTARLQQLDTELKAWQVRQTEADARLGTLAQRADGLAQQKATLADMQTKKQPQADALSQTHAAQAAQLKAAEHKLADAQTQRTAHDSAVQELQARHMALREQHIEARTRRQMLAEQLEKEEDTLTSQFDMTPAALAEQLGLKAAPQLVPADMEAELERLRAQRESLGAVNLRAQDDMQNLEAELAHMQAQRDDLHQAIGTLKRAIVELNKEGEARMRKAFRNVHAHFQTLFAQLFPGGQAQLRLSDPEHLLESGLDVMARLPGKKTQSLSLLSGGEQSLTALALIFAVFLTNPAPICVLDEADAQLDDSNVERFCQILEKLRAETQTRIFLITHHPLTMSRMDRLLGITMQEAGVSHVSRVSLADAQRYTTEPTTSKTGSRAAE